MNAPSLIRFLIAVSTSIIVGAVIWGLIAIGPPELQRKKNLDSRREADLSLLSGQIEYYWTEHGKLPADFTSLGITPTSPIARDPETGKPYGYTIEDDRTYRLCASFALSRGPEGGTWSFEHTGNWAHGAGANCFNRQAGKSKIGN